MRLSPPKMLSGANTFEISDHEGVQAAQTRAFMRSVKEGVCALAWGDNSGTAETHETVLPRPNRMHEQNNESEQTQARSDGVQPCPLSEQYEGFIVLRRRSGIEQQAVR
jgi:hypothetical protein